MYSRTPRMPVCLVLALALCAATAAGCASPAVSPPPPSSLSAPAPVPGPEPAPEPAPQPLRLATLSASLSAWYTGSEADAAGQFYTLWHHADGSADILGIHAGTRALRAVEGTHTGAQQGLIPDVWGGGTVIAPTAPPSGLYVFSFGALPAADVRREPCVWMLNGGALTRAGLPQGHWFNRLGAAVLGSALYFSTYSSTPNGNTLSHLCRLNPETAEVEPAYSFAPGYRYTLLGHYEYGLLFTAEPNTAYVASPQPAAPGMDAAFPVQVVALDLTGEAAAPAPVPGAGGEGPVFAWNGSLFTLCAKDGTLLRHEAGALSGTAAARLPLSGEGLAFTLRSQCGNLVFLSVQPAPAAGITGESQAEPPKESAAPSPLSGEAVWAIDLAASRVTVLAGPAPPLLAVAGGVCLVQTGTAAASWPEQEDGGAEYTHSGTVPVYALLPLEACFTAAPEDYLPVSDLVFNP